jgi:F420H(2)-dependent quinone reductase
VATWPDYAEYQKKTTRTIPVFVLTPVDAWRDGGRRPLTGN